MISEFSKYIQQHNLFNREDNLLAAVSGGADSVVMLHLLIENGFKPAIAHCDFQLRGDESDRDRFFVEKLAEKYRLKIFVHRFDTRLFARRQKISVEMAARRLRYEWFEELLINEHYSKILVAHNSDDNAETILLNFIRGTGYAGLSGMKPLAGNIARPLLFATRQMIEDYACKANIDYVNDSTNADKKYRRNYVRHTLIPAIKKINPSIVATLNQNARIMEETSVLMDEYFTKISQQITKNSGSRTEIDLTTIQHHPVVSTILYKLLQAYGFNSTQTTDIASVLSGRSGKTFFSASHCLCIDRDKLIINNIASNNDAEYLIYEQHQPTNDFPLAISCSTGKFSDFETIETGSHILTVDYDKLAFPLTLRKWRKGDRFYPFGMNRSKKLSDFFTDQKIALPDKGKIWILLSGNDIVWIAGFRADDRFRITKTTKTFWKCRLL